MGIPKGDVQIDSQGLKNWTLSLRGKRKYPTPSLLEQPNGMPGPLSQARIATYWGSKMKEFVTKAEFRLWQQKDLTLNHGKKNIIILVSRVKCCIPGMAE